MPEDAPSVLEAAGNGLQPAAATQLGLMPETSIFSGVMPRNKNRKTIEMTMQTAPSFEDLARAFYEVDPANTCCVPNELHEEYAREARSALAHMENGLSLLDAVSASLVFYFELEKNQAHRHAAEVVLRVGQIETQSPKSPEGG